MRSVDPKCLLVDYGYETPCWIWLRYCSKKGYGQAWNGSGVEGAHRVYYRRAKGEIPDGLQLDHLCRNRNCVNPDHLEPVTNQENLRRGAKVKLDEASVLEIRRLADEELTERRKRGFTRRRRGWQQEIAQRFGIVPKYVSQVVKGERVWR